MFTATASDISMINTESRGTTKTVKLNASQYGAIFARAGLTAVCIFMMIASVQPDIRASIRTAISGLDERKVVSTVQGHLAGDDRMYTVAKVKTAETLSLEIFEQLNNGQQKLVEKIPLTDARDGYFDFNGQASNLAMDDINGDGRPEILAPTFDNNMVGHLNIYGFDPESNSLQRVIR